MSYGTSDITVILSIKNEAHSLNPTNASAATNMDGSSPANLPSNTAENSYKWRFWGVVVGIVAGDESSLDAAEASMALRLRASVFVDEMTVVSEVP